MTTCPFFLGANGLLQTVSFDILAWTLALYAFVRIARSASPTSANPTWWLGLGAAIGLGMMTKFTMPALVAGVGVGILLTPIRRELRTPWPWLGAALALVIGTPNLAWQVAHGWPSIDFLRGQNDRISADNPTTKYIADQLFTLGPFVLIICGAGALRLWRSQRERALLWTAVTVELVYLVFHGKGYYPLDVVPVLIAAGAVSVATWKRWRLIAIGLIVFGLVALPVVLPVLPESTMIRFDLDKARDDFSAEVGWPTVVSSIARAYDALPAQERAHAIILTQNYSQASAVNVFGGPFRLPHRAERAQHLLDVAAAPRVDQHGLRRRVSVVRASPVVRATEVRWSLTQQPPHRRRRARGAPMFLCTRPLISTAALWDTVKRFS